MKLYSSKRVKGKFKQDREMMGQFFTTMKISFYSCQEVKIAVKSVSDQSNMYKSRNDQLVFTMVNSTFY